MLNRRGASKQISVEEEYKRNPWISPQDIKKLRQWVQKQPHLPSEYITDQDLILAYHFCEGSAEVSKQILDQSLTQRTLFTILFKDRDVDDSILQTLQVLSPIPTDIRTADGCHVIYIRILDPEPKHYICSDNARFAFMVADLFMYEQGTCPGIVLVVNLSGMSLGYLARLEITTLQQTLQYLQKGFLLKIKGFHLINAPPIVDKLMLILKPLLTSTLMDVFHIHREGSNTFEQFVPKEALLKYDDNEEVKARMSDMMTSNREFFLKECKKRVVEGLRPGKPRVLTHGFGGIEGSFKKLEID